MNKFNLPKWSVIFNQKLDLFTSFIIKSKFFSISENNNIFLYRFFSSLFMRHQQTLQEAERWRFWITEVRVLLILFANMCIIYVRGYIFNKSNWVSDEFFSKFVYHFVVDVILYSIKLVLLSSHLPRIFIFK